MTSERLEAGIDEVGRGCLAGPVVAAVVALPVGYSNPGFRDSKTLSCQGRASSLEKIREVAREIRIGFSLPHEIDNLNILQATFLAMNRAVDQLVVRPQVLLVDGNRFDNYHSIAHRCIVKGDQKHACISAASVVAKVFRDAWMKDMARLYPMYGWISNVGYGTEAHRDGIMRYGKTRTHRLSFRVRDFNRHQ